MHYSERLLIHIKQAERITQAAKEAAVREAGITAAQQAALAVLSDNPGINAAELARRLSVTPQTMNSLLGRMETRGLIARTPHPVHGTLIEIRLTERGAEVFAQADALVAKLDARLAEGLSPDEVAAVRDLLARIVHNAEAPGP
ncbi:MarR family transcriptional regulator [Streptomyces sp. NBC_01343]|uniref:MarR family winged helix-turn-helix transcriptional regulator n=1 Tax=Streptomyces sp. NBC_01343 TaxID=2903832 RepID=UPI002E0EB921|nr:MarR family transcriptional regulator [Streptomyces sp. NBC_01343]